VIEGKPTVVLSYSERFQDEVARPVAKTLRRFGLRPVLVGDEPLPAGIESNPNNKVEWFFLNAEMAVILATPDDRTENGEVKTRANVVDEYRLAQQKEHLREKLLVFKAEDVELHSNINPVYEPLPLDNPEWIANRIVEQAMVWGLLSPVPTPNADSGPTSSEEGTSGAPPVVHTGDDDAAATQQASDALQSASAALGGEVAKSLSIRRAELAIAGLTADEVDADPIGVHLANTLFAQRHEIILRERERLLLFATYLENTQGENVPGIYWIRGLSRLQIIELLFSLVRDGESPLTQRCALSILRKLGAPAAADRAREILRPLLSSDDAALRQDALEFIRERHELHLRDLLEDPELVERDRRGVTQTLAMLDIRVKPSDVMALYMEDEYARSPEVEAALLSSVRRVRRELILAALQNPAQEVRLTGLRMASEKGLLSESLARKIIEADGSPPVRLAVIRCLLDVGLPIDLELYRLASDSRKAEPADLTTFFEQQALESEMAMTLPLEELRAGIRWTSRNGPACYEALGLRDGEWAGRNVRRDLRTGFAALRDTERASMRAAAIATAEGTLARPLTDAEQAVAVEQCDEAWKSWSPGEKVGRFIQRQYTRAALHVLVDSGRRADVRIARQFAASGDQDLRGDALRLFARFGTHHDTATVVKLTGQIYDDELQVLGAETALRLAYKKDKLAVLSSLREVHALRRWSVEQLAHVPGAVNEAWKLLWSPNADIRIAAARVVWDAVSPEDADRLLSVYTGSHHFYNVVRAIDRRLFAPDWLGDALPGGS
jgi:CAP12/Pycsar effector protein, TIR domain